MCRLPLYAHCCGNTFGGLGARAAGRFGATSSRFGDGRLLLQRDSGIVVGVWPEHACAVGDLWSHLNEITGLISNWYASVKAREGCLLMHASAVSYEGQGVAIGGKSGAGKSTSALHLVEAGFRFLSNDRVLARAGADGVDAWGYPNRPGVNPGTVLHHPRFADMLSPADQEALRALPQHELWALERKMHPDLDAVYGPGTVQLESRLRGLVMLGWQLDGDATRVRLLDADEAMSRRAMFRSSLKTFDLQRPLGAPPSPDEDARWAELLERLTIVEISGRVNFPFLVDAVRDLLGRPRRPAA